MGKVPRRPDLTGKMRVRKRLTGTSQGMQEVPVSPYVEQVDDGSFERQVLGSGLLYLLDFSAVWCPPCRALEPILEAVARELQGRLRVGKIDIDTSPAVAARYGVRGAPTLLLFRDGKEVGRKLGLVSRSALLQLLGP